MSEVQVKETGGGGKNKQKKQQLRVDFTPMVDMNMLLITFFMLCSSLLKPETLPINMPSDVDVKEEEKNKARASGAVTLLLGSEDELYYYAGEVTDADYANPDFLIKASWNPEDPNSIRQYLMEKNKGTYEEIQALKKQRQDFPKEMPDSLFRRLSDEIQNKAMKELKIAPTVIIKPSDLSSYKNMVDALDEMLVCNIGAYAVVELTDGDRRLLFDKTKNSNYLTEAEIAQANGQ
ncbi:MAG: biopolymer transporter ExbD [Candidatus Symbiothrix sp.]|jgi:biopolymer transport protein ExbD|nr:biopolymer transporter ExbD [Candidatus Symbiothrix sp.]